MRILEVFIEYSRSALAHSFSYAYLGKEEILPGVRVLVPFHNQTLVAYVHAVRDYGEKTLEQVSEETGIALSEISEILDHVPILNPDLMALAEKVADYYQAPFVSVLQSMLPPSLTPRKSSLNGPKIAYEQYLYCISPDETGLTDKQSEILRLINSTDKVLKRDIKSVSVVNKLLEMGRIGILREEKRRLKVPDYEYREPPELNEEQKKVYDEFLNSEDKVFLLEGVTGSGKTEVYLRLSEKVLAEGKTVLMLVPEISLTPMMMEYFLRRFSGKVAILHSELTPAEKYDEYRKIASGECPVVVGARSAVFAPLRNIGLIILDEEHTESYKQDVLPFYHAREVAIMRGEMHHAKVLLGSATPSLESRARAQKNVYHLLRLTRRANRQVLPKTTIVNLLDYHNLDRESSVFSLKLRKSIRATLDRHEQAILLINRRGFSTTVTCRRCGHVFRCPTCGIALTYHKSDNMLKCHHCDYVEKMPDACPECGNTYLMKTGFGTERIEEETNRLFPEAKTLRLDSDSAKIRNRIPSIVEAFRKKEADILIGTQMIAKGHDFPDVTLVGCILADIGLNMPSFRSAERTFQLITQAIGRSGRSGKPGEAIIQTYAPDHYAITMAARQDYELFYRKEMEMRKVQQFPPYTYLASVTVRGKDEEKVIDEIFRVIDFLNASFDGQALVLGPTTPYVAYENNVYLRNALIKYRSPELARSVFRKLASLMNGRSGTDYTVNIDPYNF